MKYKVDDEIFDTIEEVLDYCIDAEYHWNDDEFDEWVNDNWGCIEINGTEYYAYDIISQFDDICEVKDTYCERCNDDDRDEAWHELRNATPGEEVYVQAYTVECIEDYETGDYDGDECFEPNALERLRVTIEQAQKENDAAAEKEKKNDDDMWSMFQVIK